VFGSCTKIPAFDTVWCPGATVGGGLVYEDFGSGRCKWRAIEIESAVELGFRGKARVDM
jgi:hypothetical protein